MLLAAALLAAGAWPLMREAAALAAASGRGQVDFEVVRSMDWPTLLPQVLLMAAGVLGLLGAYLWWAYRLVHGVLQLAMGAPAPGRALARVSTLPPTADPLAPTLAPANAHSTPLSTLATATPQPWAQHAEASR